NRKINCFRSSGLRIYKFNFETALSFWRCRFILSHNGPRLGDSGGLESQNFQSFTNLSNSFLLFTKLTKKEI
ncbi:hypothetical protein, partial [Bergeyella sp. RCAD1439]|nr:hypothetical protein [Bergeyella sp. RCAD1439]